MVGDGGKRAKIVDADRRVGTIERHHHPRLARLLSTLVEQELAERDRRRIARHLAQARLLPAKTLETFDFTAVPMLSKAHVSAITAGDSWIGKGSNILLFGPPGVGKSHLGSAIGLALVEQGYRVLFSRTTDLVQKLQ
ncbi:MAG: ATP-binding protein, partial [Rhodobacteraceae bacterium]|nr:ATP-binding protein [Paracoccaceae bacterium]